MGYLMSPKIIGLICAFGCESWISYSIKQALEFCDDVYVNISAHSSILNKYEDNTHNIARDFGKDINLIDINFNQSNHALIKPAILNYMMALSPYFSVGNWIWVFDSDEYYTINGYKTIQDIVYSNRFNEILMEEYYFYINTKKYLEGSHPRLFKIEEININPNYRFVPAQRWTVIDKRSYTLDRDLGMRHYGMLQNPNMKLDMWKTEYPNKSQDNKVTWIDTIYRKYNLDDEETWISENERMFGIKSPWFSSSFVPDKGGKLFTYNGDIPTFLKDSGFDKIEDFRKEYNFI
uniref:Glycosyltransferase n=1 Tax=viral metagenome TaxID=1070528 RepID=A0A6H1ZKP3_9ZZZZ